MSRKPNRHHLSGTTNKQKGSMLVIALFVIIVLALLGLTVTRLLSSSSESIIYEVLGQRALNAARAGIECSVARKYPISSPANPYCAGSDGVTFTFTGVPGLENCSYITTLEDIAIVDGGNTFTHSKFSGTGQCSAGNIIVSRTVYIDSMQENP